MNFYQRHQQKMEQQLVLWLHQKVLIGFIELGIGLKRKSCFGKNKLSNQISIIENKYDNDWYSFYLYNL